MASFRSLLVAGLAATQVLAAPTERDADHHQQQKCKEVSFNVKGSALNRALDPITNLLNDTEALVDYILADNFTKTFVVGQEILAGWYCEPLVQNGNNKKLQFFETSILTNHDSFLAQGGTNLGPGPSDVDGPVYPAYQPENYNWALYAGKLGYPSLIMDHPGNGKSSRPDPILVAQGPYEYSLIHDLVGQIKTGTTGQLPCAYQELIFVGNSYGSVIGDNMAALYPKDFDTLVLTGFTKSVLPSFLGVALGIPTPAILVDPIKFSGYSIGYLTQLINQGRINSFFGSPDQADFDPEVAKLFGERKDVVSLGQVVSTYLDFPIAEAFTGRVLVLTGEHDQAFCGPGSPVLGEAHCRNLLPDTKELFPASDYSYYSVPQSGHALILHKSYATTLDVAHRFMAGENFAVSVSGVGI